MVIPQRRNPNPIPFLPRDIIYQVFLWLPVVDLLRSKSVCKLWLSIISSPDFVKAHLSKSSNDPQFTRHHLLLLNCIVNNSPFQLIKSCSLYSLLNHEPVNEPVELAFPDRISLVVGYCNGLICLLCGHDYLFFWNPSTRQSRRLPKFVTDTNPADGRRLMTSYGFCYDELNDEFKVFAISVCDWKPYKISVYSSKSDSWRLIGDFACGYLSYGGYLVNGALHWIVYPDGQLSVNNSIKIVSVDIKTETYRKVLLPNCIQGKYCWSMAKFGESLSVLCDEDSQTDLWVMKKCDGEESWIKLFTIPHMDRLKVYWYVQPICISTNGDIVLGLEKSIILYNSRDQTFKDLLDNINCETYTYVESLISPHL